MTGNEQCAVIIFDGECAFCQAQVKRIRRRDTRNLFEYLPRHIDDTTEKSVQLQM